MHFYNRLQKEKDLELTARIGKELLTANGRLEARVTALEGELRSARDHITQLRHDLNAKTDLLQVGKLELMKIEIFPMSI